MIKKEVQLISQLISLFGNLNLEILMVSAAMSVQVKLLSIDFVLAMCLWFVIVDIHFTILPLHQQDYAYRTIMWDCTICCCVRIVDFIANLCLDRTQELLFCLNHYFLQKLLDVLLCIGEDVSAILDCLSA